MITNELKESNIYIENYERYLEITKKIEFLNEELKIKEDNGWRF